jgi:hypothetical protein
MSIRGKQINNAVFGIGEPGDEGLAEGIGERCDLLHGLHEVRREAGVVHGEVAVGTLRDEVGKDRLHLLRDEAGVGRAARGFGLPIVRDRIELKERLEPP